MAEEVRLCESVRPGEHVAAQVDREMNLTLVDVSCRALEGKAQELEFLYVKGRSVRCEWPF